MQPEVEVARRAGQLTFGVLLWILCFAPDPAVFSTAPPVQAPVATAAPATLPSDAEIERFLLNAKLVKTRGAGKGVTGSIRATMTDGTLTHDVHIQTIDESKKEFRSAQGVEFNFRDSWMFNVAAYKIDRLLGMGLVPVSVPRRHRTAPGAFTWWVDDVMMDEGDRLKKKIAPPNSARWSEQMQLVRMFDQLIANIDRNMGNLVITRDWRIWAIDHTRAFRYSRAPRSTAGLTGIDRTTLQKLEALEFATLQKEIGEYISDADIRTMLSRRDGIVAHYKTLGDSAAYDRRDHTGGCGSSVGSTGSDRSNGSDRSRNP